MSVLCVRESYVYASSVESGLSFHLLVGSEEEVLNDRPCVVHPSRAILPAHTFDFWKIIRCMKNSALAIFFSFSSCLRMLLCVLSLHYLVEKSLLLLISFSLYRDVFPLRPLLNFFFLSLALRCLMISWFDNYFLHVHFSFLYLWVYTFPQIWVEYFSVSKFFLSSGRH